MMKTFLVLTYLSNSLAVLQLGVLAEECKEVKSGVEIPT